MAKSGVLDASSAARLLDLISPFRLMFNSANGSMNS